MMFPGGPFPPGVHVQMGENHLDDCEIYGFVLASSPQVGLVQIVHVLV